MINNRKLLSVLTTALIGAPFYAAFGATTIYEVNATYLVQEVDISYFAFCDGGPSAPNCGDFESGIDEGDFLLATYRFGIDDQIAEFSPFQASGLRLSHYAGASFIGSETFDGNLIALNDFTGGDTPGNAPVDAFGHAFVREEGVDLDLTTIDAVLFGDVDLFPTTSTAFDAEAFEAAISAGVLFVEQVEFFESASPPVEVYNEIVGGNLVQLDIREVGINNGDSPTNPLLPILPVNPDDPIFVFEVPPEDVIDGVPIWIDPAITTGYDYNVFGAEIAQIIAPDLSLINDPDGYLITIDGTEYVLLPGETLTLEDIGLTGITGFRLSGIDPALMLDPTDPLAFVLGITPTNANPLIPLQITQDPLVAPIPLPAGFVLAASGLAALASVGLRRRRRTLR